MAKFSKPAGTTAPAPTRPPVKTDTRNSAIPRSTTSNSAAPRQITHEMIAKRAYEIFLSGKGGSSQDNWLRAERELRGMR